ncbi:MAG: DinB family protein [Gemmatimonadetes bacterium]|nr:DinB family protein [Gemmatimonadota bacterium]
MPTGYRERPAAGEYNAFYARYVERVPEGDILELLRTQVEETAKLLLSAPAARHDWAYAPGKWTLKEVVGHICDTERVMTYRALRAARADATPLASFDENAWVPQGAFGERTMESLVAELVAVRQATLALFSGLPAAAWTRVVVASGHPVSVRALAWIVAGHELHHRAGIQERYLEAGAIRA